MPFAARVTDTHSCPIPAPVPHVGGVIMPPGVPTILIGSLPAATVPRLRRALQPLTEFPLIGSPLSGRWTSFRFILGPWRWMVFVYAYFEPEDRVVVVTVQDARSSGAATGSS